MSEYIIVRSDELTHWGIKGQKWGVRRYQNEDGSYTKEGKERYNKRYRTDDGSMTEAGRKKYEKALKTSQGEKISSKQMAKNALKRGTVGAVVGSSVAQLADRVAKKKAFDNSVNQTINLVDFNDPEFSAKTKDVLFDSNRIVPTGFHTKDGKKVTDYAYAFEGAKFKSPGKASAFAKAMTSNLLTAPTYGALIGAGTGALGSVTVDSIHNLKIGRAKKFVEQYKSSYEKTYGGQG